MYCPIHHEKHKGIRRKALCAKALDKGITRYDSFIQFCEDELKRESLRNKPRDD